MIITIGTEVFKSKIALTTFITKSIKTLGETSSIKNIDYHFYLFLCELVKRHPSYNMFGEITDISSQLNAMKTGLELTLINTNSETYTISRETCINGQYKSINRHFYSALRVSIDSQIYDFKQSADITTCSQCKLKTDKPQIDHIIHFEQIVHDFLQSHSITPPFIYDEQFKTFQSIFKETDKYIGDLFSEYHNKHATLRVLCQNCNLTRPTYKKS